MVLVNTIFIDQGRFVLFRIFILLLSKESYYLTQSHNIHKYVSTRLATDPVQLQIFKYLKLGYFYPGEPILTEQFKGRY